MLPQAGVAIGMALVACAELPDYEQVIATDRDKLHGDL